MAPQKRHLAAPATIISPHSGQGRRGSASAAAVWAAPGLPAACISSSQLGQTRGRLQRRGAGRRPSVAPISSASCTILRDHHDLPQAGHLAFLPAAESGAESVLPQDGQFMLIGTISSTFQGRVSFNWNSSTVFPSTTWSPWFNTCRRMGTPLT